MPLTADDARAIADELLAAAQDIDTYLDKNFNSIERSEYESLYQSFTTLLRTSSFVTTAAVGLAIGELENPVDELKDVVNTAKDKIKNLQQVGKIIRIASGLTDLASGLLAKDVGAIAKSVKNLHDMF